MLTADKLQIQGNGRAGGIPSNLCGKIDSTVAAESLISAGYNELLSVLDASVGY